MARHTIAATVRGFLFALRADWTDPDCPVEIDASESVDAPPGHEWQETGDTVEDWTNEVSPLPLHIYYDNLDLPDPLPPTAVSVACMALAGFVSAHFDDWQAPDLTAAAVLAHAAITNEEPKA